MEGRCGECRELALDLIRSQLAREGNGSSGPMGVKSIAKHLNESGIQSLRQPGAQAHANRVGRLSPRPSPCAGPAGGSDKEARIMGSKGVLLRTLVAASGAKSAGFGMPGLVPKWRATQNKTANSHVIEIAL